MANNGNGQVGQVVQIIGPVVDVEFSDNYLPPIYQALRITSEGFDVDAKVDTIAEVQQLSVGRSLPVIRHRSVRGGPTAPSSRGRTCRRSTRA